MTTTDNSDLRDRVAQRATGTDVERADRAPSAATLVRQAIERQSTAFQAVLPSTVEPERFSRLVLTAIKATPQLMECFGTEQGQVTVLLSAMQAAAVGLEPNTPTQECWLLPRKIKGTWECQLQIGYRGYMKLARRSGTIKTIFAEVVRERDHFHWERGLAEDILEHRPWDGDGPAGEMTHSYAIARYTNGGYSFVVLNRSQIEARRELSDSWRSDRGRDFSPWTRWTEAMWRKTAVRALVPYLDLSPEVERAVAIDGKTPHFDDEAGVIEALSAPEPVEEPEVTPDDAAAKARAKDEREVHARAKKAFPDIDSLSAKENKEVREAKRHALARNLTNGRTGSLPELTDEEVVRLISWLRDSEDGRVQLVPDEGSEDGWRVELTAQSGGEAA